MPRNIDLQIENKSDDKTSVLVYQKRRVLSSENEATTANAAAAGASASTAKVIHLRLVNKSTATNSQNIVIFQGNGAQAVAWRVIQYLAPGNYHPFTFSSALEVSASDNYGNYTPAYGWEPGQIWEMVRISAGNVLQLSSQTNSDPEVVEITNALPEGAITANVLRDGLVTATKSSVAPGQSVSFKLPSSIKIGVAAGVQQGQLMSPEAVSSINTEISLLGIASADIVMTGDGSEPFVFRLENVTVG
jgi:hypothetical protein